MANLCSVTGCKQAINKPGHTLCYPHWKAEKAGRIRTCGKCSATHEGDLCPVCDDNPADTLGAATLTSTKLGAALGVTSRKMNLILSELGWIEKYTKGWTPTQQGNALGAELRTARNGVPYAVWPESILEQKALKRTIESINATVDSEPEPNASEVAASATTNATEGGSDFRDRFPPKLRTCDGHMVRSRAEVMIDDYLYFNGIVHAYERKLPIDEDVYCDFYLPEKKVYIEFWGLEDQPAYRERKEKKLAIYRQYGLNLIELADKEVARLDDHFPRLLLPFGFDCT